MKEQREIKYRAWDKQSKQMFSVYALEFRDDGIWVCLDWKSKASGLRENWLSPDRLEIMQYTGLQEKNGKEVYEFMGLDNRWEVDWLEGKYILRDISTGDIIDLDYENKYTITREYTKIQENPEGSAN